MIRRRTLLAAAGGGLATGTARADRGLTLIVCLAGLTGTLTLFGLLAAHATAAVFLLFLLGLFGFAAVPGLITRVTDAAGGTPLAASANVSASNLGNALGAWLGGPAISAGLGYRSPLYAALTSAGPAVLTYAARTASRPA